MHCPTARIWSPLWHAYSLSMMGIKITTCAIARDMKIKGFVFSAFLLLDCYYKSKYYRSPPKQHVFPFSLLMLMSILNYERHCSFLPNTILVLYIPSMLTCLYSCSFKMAFAASKWAVFQFFRYTTLQIKPGRIIFLFFAPFNLLYVRTIYLLLLCSVCQQ